MNGVLYVVATPIGNLGDITLRALETLKEVDCIACENPLYTLKLLNHFEIKKRLLEHSPANQANSAKGIISLLKDGKNIALVTDSGTPCVSDPGQLLVRLVAEEGIRVIPIPGPSALTALVSASGFPSDRLVFLGFLSKKEGKATRELNLFRDIDCTVGLYASPHQIIKVLEWINKVFGNVEIIIGREMTKMNEEFIRGNISDIVQSPVTEKGEFAILIHNGKREKKEEED
ncbi:MAG: 16S rRNA (cytidine(1402)-2'-O)-methyltransferase [Spirochaetes bacterium GWF1_51_8]|nr:MAG: 16S rRNA (cytidine(1402)-2'-O)-methyltransferase [Spirochaetes bacterium GWF1_51_8]